MDKRNAPADASWGSPERLAGSRLALAGAPGADAATWITRAACVGLVLAALWWTWVVLRPLPPVQTSESAAPPRIPSIDTPVVDDARRSALVEGLARENLYSAGRAPWARVPMGGAVAGATGEPAEDEAAVAAKASAATVGGSAAVAFTPTEQLPDDVKKALAALELKALRAESSGGGVAMISLVHSPTRQQSTAYRPGDEFKDEANPNAAWRVVAVDLSRRRVLLSRSGVTAALPLYKGLGDGPVVGASAGEGSELAGTGVRIEGRTRDEIMMELRTKGLPESDIQAVIEELDRQLVDAGQSPVQALGQIVATPESAQDEAAGRRSPPPGMEAILQMMEAQSKAVKEKPEGDAPPAKRPGRSPRRKP